MHGKYIGSIIASEKKKLLSESQNVCKCILIYMSSQQDKAGMKAVAQRQLIMYHQVEGWHVSQQAFESCFCYIGQKLKLFSTNPVLHAVLFLTNQQSIAIFFLPKHFSLVRHKLDASVTLCISHTVVIILDIFSHIKIIQFLLAALKAILYNRV